MKKNMILILLFILFLNAYAQEWTYQEDFLVNIEPYTNGPHGVVVTPDDKIWIGWHGYTDFIIKNNGDTVKTCPILIYEPDGTLVKKIQFLTYNNVTDTLVNWCRGMSLDNNGNVLYTAWDKLWRINYKTYEAMNKVVPEVDMALTEAACDENGYIYLTHVIPDGKPLYIFDQNFVLYDYVDEAVYSLQRSIVTSPDGKDVYVGKIYGGENNDNNGIIHYHSDSGPGGTYSKVDSFHTHIWGQCLDWDRSGLLWVGSYWDIAPYDSSGWYAMDPAQNFKIVNHIGQNVGMDPGEGPQPPSGGTYYAPRGAAWSTDGHYMYTADFDGNVVKKWYNPNPEVSSIQLSIGIFNAYPGDTIQIPLNVTFNTHWSFSSTQIDINGFQGKLEFLDVNDDSCIVGNAGWTTEVNSTDSLLKIASAGSQNINESGILLWLVFAIPDTADSGFVPINIKESIFNTGSIPTYSTSGGVNITPFTIKYGDVDLNDTVQSYDASLILKYLVDLTELSKYQSMNANVSMDSTISGLDATLILQYVVGIIDTLPYDGSNQNFIPTGDINMADQEVTPGDTVEVPLYLENGSNIFSFEGNLTFDPSKLTFNKFVWSSLLNDFTTEVNEIDGTIKFAGAGAQKDGNEGIFGKAIFAVNTNFELDSTIVRLKKLRWNEAEVQTDVAQAILFNITSIKHSLSIKPQQFELNQNYPNPFNPITTIKYALPKGGKVKLEVFNLLGQKVTTLVNGFKQAGYHQVTFDGSGLPSGEYYYRLQTDKGFVQTRKFVLLK